MIMNITYGISIGKILLKGCKYDYSAISGGLGNQMFQYAPICALKKTYPDVLIKADITDYKKRIIRIRDLVLEKYFNIQIPVADKKRNKKKCIWLRTLLCVSDLTVEWADLKVVSP